MRQLSFLPAMKLSTRLDHGGDVHKGKRKIARPFDPSRPMHIVMRSSRARGDWSMLKPRHRDWIERLLERVARRYGIKIHRFVNVGNHLHLLASATGQRHKTSKSLRYLLARADLASFLRQFTGMVGHAITGATKGHPQGRFWNELVYSRIVTWGREFENVMRYLVKNIFESAGIWDRKKFPNWQLVTLKCGPPD